MTFQPGQHLTTKIDGTRVEVIKASKDGKRVYVSFWANGIRPKLIKEWMFVSAFTEAAR